MALGQRWKCDGGGLGTAVFHFITTALRDRGQIGHSEVAADGRRGGRVVVVVVARNRQKKAGQ